MLEATLEAKNEEDRSGTITRPVLYIQLPSTSWRAPCYSNLLWQEASLTESVEIRHAPERNLIKLDLVQQEEENPYLTFYKEWPYKQEYSRGWKHFCLNTCIYFTSVMEVPSTFPNQPSTVFSLWTLTTGLKEEAADSGHDGLSYNYTAYAKAS